jgi:hypothetical protein
VIYHRAGYVQFTVSLIASLHHCIHYSLAFFLYEVAGSSARNILSQYTPVPSKYHPYIVIPNLVGKYSICPTGNHPVHRRELHQSATESVKKYRSCKILQA